MAFEYLLLSALIIIFIGSFCGLLQKIRQSYENERARSEAETRTSVPSLTEVYINPVYLTDNVQQNASDTGIFPGTPPPYSEFYCEPPPKYEDVIKDQNFISHTTHTTA